MRIVAGELRGQPFSAPPGTATRPTTDRVREAIFSSVFSLFGDLDGAAVLDLFAGSGAMGFEALSRGAARAVGVESARQAQRTIESNASKLGLTDRYTLVGCEAATASARIRAVAPAGGFGVVFLDPPYAVEPSAIAEILGVLAAQGELAPGALVCYEHAPRADAVWGEPFHELRTKKYGDTALSYARYLPSSDGDDAEPDPRVDDFERDTNA